MTEADSKARKVSVRALVWQQHGNDEPRFHATASGSVNTASRGHFRKHVIGYAEFPMNTAIEAKTDYAAFREEVEDKATYVHWKPSWERTLGSDDA